MVLSVQYHRFIFAAVFIIALATLYRSVPHSSNHLARITNAVWHAPNSSDVADSDMVFPTFEYTYDKLAEITSDLRVVRDPCEDVALPDGGRQALKSEGTLVLVTGGAGFIGSNLVDRLLVLGYRVRIFDNLYTGFLRNVPLGDSRVEFYFGDILDRAALKEAITGVDFVYHLAAMSKVVPSLKSPNMARFCVESNALGSWNVLEEARLAGKIKKVIYAASSTYYGNAPAPHREDMAGDFLTPYAASKFEGELQMHTFDQLFGVNTISTRFFMVYGPRQPSTGAYAIVTGVFAKQAADGKPLTIEGDGTHSRDFIHVSDIVEGLILAQQAPDLHGDVVNLGTGEAYSVQDVADLVSNDQVYLAPRENDLIGTLADTCKMKRLLNYKARANFTTEMSYMVKQTMEGNVFVQDWLTTSHVLSTPHLLPSGNPMLAWPKTNDDLDALLLSLQHLVEKAPGKTGSEKRLITVLPLLVAANHESGDSILAYEELLLNTVYSLVRYGGVTRYMFSAADDQALEMCATLNLPCFDGRSSFSSGPALINALLSRGYDVHFASIGNSYVSSVVPFFYSETHSSADIVYAAPQGDFLIRSNDRSRPAFENWASIAKKPLEDEHWFDVGNWPDLDLPKASYNVEYFCGQSKDYISFPTTPKTPEHSVSYPPMATATAGASQPSGEPHESLTSREKRGPLARSTHSLCDTASRQFYLGVGCTENPSPMVRAANATVEALVAANAFHLNRCKDVEYCDIQQLIPLTWVQKTPELGTGGTLC
ncbi:hypothetical protein PV11_05048 [Exophiala sideris]|uniref:NAD-dependent epimerase/dehydratase domain-containing protein n=1 Tax=Exophiala sideris TaxID=1016849 RepID=A0A0D1X5L3_9EURO|nr:hypothetical protein PV11_05048 [Exophiala sideris]